MHPKDVLVRAVKSLHDAALHEVAWLSIAARINEATGAEGHALAFAEGRLQHVGRDLVRASATMASASRVRVGSRTERRGAYPCTLRRDRRGHFVR